MRRTGSQGFTLIELLVVIAIIAILAAILFPVFSKAKQQAQKTKCLANLSQIAKAMKAYCNDNDGRWPIAYNDNQGNWHEWTWRERVQPYCKDRKVFVCPAPNYYRESNPYPDLGNTPAGRAKMAEWIAYSSGGIAIGHYGMNRWIASPDARYDPKIMYAPSDISRPAETIFIGENGDGDWSLEPRENDDTGVEGQSCPYHGDGVNYIMADGHYTWLNEKATDANDKYYWKIIKDRRYNLYNQAPN